MEAVCTPISHARALSLLKDWNRRKKKANAMETKSARAHSAS